MTLLPPSRLIVLLLAVYAGLHAHDASQPAIQAEYGPTYADGAHEWRLMTLRDEQGRIAQDGLQRARAHMNRMRLRASRFGAASASAGAARVSRAGWRWLGPGNIGGRVRSIAIHPTNPSTMFTGSVSGGIWRSDDAAASWRPVNDFMANLSVSSIIIHPRNPDIMYAGTGEEFGAELKRGNGVFGSTDGGVTWSQLPGTAGWTTVDRLAMSHDGTVLLAAVFPRIYRSIDGGATFAATTPDVTGFVDMEFHPTDNSRAIIANNSGRVYYTRDGGQTWQPSTMEPTLGRMEIAYARSQPETVYLITANGDVFLSADGGASYVRQQVHLDGDVKLRARQGWYNLSLWVNPSNPNHVIAGMVELFESTDGGVFWRTISGNWANGGIHPDHHVIVEHPAFDNALNRTVYFGNDGGVYQAELTAGEYIWISRNENLGITQFYGAAGNAAGQIVGGTQDNGTLLYRPEKGANWTGIYGGDGGFSAADPTDPNIFYAELPYLLIVRSTDGGQSARPITVGISDAGKPGLANFIAPFILDPNNPNRMLAGGRSLWRTEDVKATPPTWSVMKTAAPGDGNISAIAVAAGNPDIVWAGHSYGSRALITTLSGTAASPSWTHVDSIPTGPMITRITIDPTDHNVVYVSRGGFGNTSIVRTDDGGLTWTDATGTGDAGLPDVPVRDVEVDPLDSFTIYAATEVGLFVSPDRGTTWQLPNDGPANVSVDELFLMGTTLVAATHGRGLFAVELGVSGTPAVGLAPSPMTFAPRPVATESPRQSLHVTNTGSAPLTVQSLWLSGSDPSHFSVSWTACANRTLPPGASCEASVSFTPWTAGTRSALVMTGTTAPGGPHSVTVSGVGSAAPLPSPWLAGDIGDAGIAGRASYTEGIFTAEGAGSEIWMTSDAFHFVHRPWTGDGDLVARVEELTKPSDATVARAGVMIRESLSPGSRHASLLLAADGPAEFRWRETTGGFTSSNEPLGGITTVPRWLKLSRRANLFTAYMSSDGSSWTPVHTGATIAMAQTVDVGFFILRSGGTGLARTRLTNVQLASPTGGNLPPGWSSTDVGSVGSAGSATHLNGRYAISAGGVDLWSSADALHFVHRQWTGDGDLVAQVSELRKPAGATFALTGIMLRETVAAGSRHAALVITSDGKAKFRRRVATGGTTLSHGPSVGTTSLPRWVKLSRRGNMFTAYLSADGTHWTQVHVGESIALPSVLEVGLLALTNGGSGRADAALTNVDVSAPSALPSGWTNGDVGSAAVPGSAAYANGTFTIGAGGTDLWSTADAFHFAYRQWTGDGEVVARLTSLRKPDGGTFALGAVMFRASLEPNAPHASMMVTSDAKAKFRRRVTAAAATLSDGPTSGTTPLPRWIKVVRRANTFAAYLSLDGIAWQPVHAAESISMPSTVYVGLVGLRNGGVEQGTIVLDNVTIR